MASIARGLHRKVFRNEKINANYRTFLGDRNLWINRRRLDNL